jgi:ABC-type phosphate transport system auxiliary subunit
MTQSKSKNSRATSGPPKGIEHLLSQQTTVILHAVDERLEKQNASLIAEMDRRFVAQNIALSAAMDKRLAKLEERFMQKLNSLTNTLEKFLQRMTDMEEEFVFMKHDVNRIKAVLREKLGVTID